MPAPEESQTGPVFTVVGLVTVILWKEEGEARRTLGPRKEQEQRHIVCEG